MKFETPAGANPTDKLEVLGKPTSRYEGPLKTTGTATYAYEHNEAVPNAAYGYVLGAAIAKGTIRSINLRRANASPGVLGIVTYQNIPRIGVGDFYVDRTLAGPEVAHYHQAVAVVAAETFEQARAAANLIEVKYDREPGKFDLAAGMSTAVAPKAGPVGRAGPGSQGTGLEGDGQAQRHPRARYRPHPRCWAKGCRLEAQGRASLAKMDHAVE